MPLLGKPGSHLAGIFADADQFRGKVQAQDQYLHRLFTDKLIMPPSKT